MEGEKSTWAAPPLGVEHYISALGNRWEKVIPKEGSKKCCLWGDRAKTVAYIINECEMHALGEYKNRHDWVALIIHWVLCLREVLLEPAKVKNFGFSLLVILTRDHDKLKPANNMLCAPSIIMIIIDKWNQSISSHNNNVNKY